VVGVPGHVEPVPWPLALGVLRSEGVTALRLVLPEPGDVLGLPGPAAVTEAATEAGEAAVLVGGPDAVLVPTLGGAPPDTVVRWDVLPAAPSHGTGGLPTLAEAERGLASRVAESIATLEALGLARGREDVAARLAAVDQRVRLLRLPDTLPTRALRLVESATRLAAVVALATEDDGAAVTAGEAHSRREALRPLSEAARHALCAGYGAGAEPAVPRTRP
jgi:hypothetical protein